MKKLNKKLQLNKETIARLNNDEQASVNGGQIGTITCTPNSEICGGDSLGCPIVCPIFDTRVMCLSFHCESSDTKYSCNGIVCIPLTDANGCRCPNC